MTPSPSITLSPRRAPTTAPNRMVQVRMLVLLAILASVGFYAWRQSDWRGDLGKIEAWLEMRADRRALKELIELDKKWGKSADGHLLTARAFRHLGKEDLCREELNRAAVRGASPAMVAQESRLLNASFARQPLSRTELDDLLSNPQLPFYENADAVMTGLIRRRESLQIQQLLQLWNLQEPETFWIGYYAGLVKAQVQDLEGALKLFEKAYEIQPKFIPLSMEIGKTLWTMQSSEKAIDYLQRVVDVEPDYDEANSALAQAFASLGRFKEAEAIMRPFIDPSDVCSDGPRQLGKVLIGLKRYPEAIAAMLPAIRVWPKDLELNQQLSECYQLIGDEKQTEIYEQATKRSIEATESIMTRRTRIASEPGNVGLLVDLGHDIMQYISRIEGRDALEQAIAIDDRFPLAHRDLALFYRLTGVQDLADMHQLRAAELEMEQANAEKKPDSNLLENNNVDSTK